MSTEVFESSQSEKTTCSPTVNRLLILDHYFGSLCNHSSCRLQDFFDFFPNSKIQFSVCFFPTRECPIAPIFHEGLFLSFHSRTRANDATHVFILFQVFIRILPPFPKRHQILDNFSFYFIYKNKQRGFAMTPERANECHIPFLCIFILCIIGRIKTCLVDKISAHKYF